MRGQGWGGQEGEESSGGNYHPFQDGDYFSVNSEEAVTRAPSSFNVPLIGCSIILPQGNLIEARREKKRMPNNLAAGTKGVGSFLAAPREAQIAPFPQGPFHTMSNDLSPPFSPHPHRDQ